MNTLYDIVTEAQDIRPAIVLGKFREWADSPAGQRAVSRGIEEEMEHTTKRSVARTLVLQHLQKDRLYYEKMAKSGIIEGVYDDPETARKDIIDDIPDQGEPVPNPSLFLGIHAIENPNKAKATAGKSKQHKRSMMLSLRELVSHATEMFKIIQAMPVSESSMGIAGPMIPNPEVDPGTGIPVRDPLNKSKRNKKRNDPAPRLKPGSPADASMIGQNPMMPGRSAFAKGIE